MGMLCAKRRIARAS